MKRIATLLATAAFMLAFAYTSTAQISVSAGYGLANNTTKMKMGNTTAKDDPQNVSGVYLGASYNIGLVSEGWGDVSVVPGVTYAYYGKCLKRESEVIGGVKTSARESIREHYLDIPVYGSYSYNIVPGTLKLSAYAGPVFSLGLSSTSIDKTRAGDNWMNTWVNNYSGTVKEKGESLGEKISTKTKGAGTGYGRFDLKFGFGIGVGLFDTFDVKFGYNIGMLNRQTGEQPSDMKFVVRTNMFYLGVAFNL